MKRVALTLLVLMGTLCGVIAPVRASEKSDATRMVKRKPVMPPLLPTMPPLVPSIADPSLILGSDETEGADKAPAETGTSIGDGAKAKPVSTPNVEIKPPPPKVPEGKTETVTAPPASGPATPSTAGVVKEQLDKGAPASEATPEGEVAVILSGHRFYPARVRLKEGQAIKLIFTTLNKKPAALVMEQLQVQRWIAKEDGSTNMESEIEITRELSPLRITEISLRPKKGAYSFHDALSGAVGEIVVE